MAGALHHADLLAVYRFGANVLELVVFARDEPAWRRVVAAREVGLGERVGVDADRGDGGVGLAVVEVLEQILPVNRPDLALDRERLADGAGEIDVEPGQHALLVEIMEGRIVAVGDEAKPIELELVGLGAKHVALPHIGDDVGLGLGPGDRMGGKQAEKKCGAEAQRSHNHAPRMDGAAASHRNFLLCPATRC